MPEADLSFLTVAVAAVLISGISKGGFGGGLGFVATPLLALTAPPAAAAAIMLPILIMIDQVGMYSYWRKWSWAAVWPTLIAAAAGIGLGMLAFGAVSASLLRLGLGVIAILFLIFQLTRKFGWTPDAAGPRAPRAAFWGAVAGFTSTISHAGGPPVTIYLLAERLEKTVYQASTVLIFWAINLMKIGPYAALGVLDLSSLSISLMLAPAAIVGVLIGIWAHKRVPETLYFRAVAILLGLTGAKLIWDGLAGMP
ncbi:MAG: sulfite exporter TauE/SafE family protein [Pikeienuella sp.]